MDSVLHGVQGALITKGIGFITSAFGVNLSWEYLLAGAIIGVMPDLVGWLEKVIKNRYVWNWYKYCHRLHWSNPFIYFPQGLFHILQDVHTHGEGKKWWIPKEVYQVYKGVSRNIFVLIKKCLSYERVSWEVYSWMGSIFIGVILCHL